MTDFTWTEHELAQIRRWRATTPAARLRWLEAAKRFAFAVRASRVGRTK